MPGSNLLGVHPAVGVQFHCAWRQSDAARNEIATKLAAAGVRSVRIDLGWHSLEPSRHRLNPWYVRLADRCVNLVRSKGMDVLATLLWTPAWANRGHGAAAPPTRAADFR